MIKHALIATVAVVGLATVAQASLTGGGPAALAGSVETPSEPAAARRLDASRAYAANGAVVPLTRSDADEVDITLLDGTGAVIDLGVAKTTIRR